MADFTTAQQYVQVAEGGYSRDTNDSGNYNNFDKSTAFVGTKFGVSAPTLSAYLGRPATAEDMLALTYETALAIYKKNYWDELTLDSVNNQSISGLIYDGSINQGVGAMSRVVSNVLGINATLPFSQDTISAINNYEDQQDLFNKLAAERIALYPSSSPYYEGWVARVQGIVYDATQEVVAAVKKNP